MIRTAIIEDETLAGNKLERLLGKQDHPVTVVKRLCSCAEAISYLSSHHAALDLIFLDIHLGDGNAFEIFEQVSVDTPIIFTTAYNQYAIQAFQQNSVDYLLKPLTEEALTQALDKYKRVYFQQKYSPVDYQKLAQFFKPDFSPKERFIVYIGPKIRSVDIQDIAHFHSEQGNTFLTTFEGKTYDISYSLDKLLSMLDPKTFYRVNRKVIVHIRSIREAYQFSKSKLKLELSPKTKFDVFVPLDKVVAFKQWLGK